MGEWDDTTAALAALALDEAQGGGGHAFLPNLREERKERQIETQAGSYPQVPSMDRVARVGGTFHQESF